MPEEVIKAWDEREGPVIFSTVDNTGRPNSIYATCVSRSDSETFVVANNYFAKTLENIRAGSKGSFLFITGKGTSYQVKGEIGYHENGPLFDDMKKWNPQEHPGHAAVSLTVREVYKGAEKLL